MASWFSSAALSSGIGDAITGLVDKVQSRVNSIDPDLIKKLTLQSDDIVAERKQIDDEEQRKEAVRDSLSEILPWETRDAEMEILVDECREVILGLSSKSETFTGPFVLDGGLSTGKDREDDDDGDDNGHDDDDRKMAKDVAAADESAEKLSKLQPLPALLANFDLDTHVGLIQRLLKVDPKLVDMQMRLSSGGERESTFWKNYFFHCAYTRYEAGLSIDEIWSNEPRASRPVIAAASASVMGHESSGELIDEQSMGELVFDSASTSGAGSIESGSDDIAIEGGAGIGSVANDTQLNNSMTATIQQTSMMIRASFPTPSSPRKDATPQSSANPPSPESGQYEFVASGGGDKDDGSIDELEAEIAAALDD